MNRLIEFRRVHFIDEEMTKFSRFTPWGVNIGISGATFTSPSSNNYALWHIDEQFTGLTDKSGVKIFANDLRKDDDGVVFRIYETYGGFVIKALYWMDDINDLIQTDELITDSLSNPQTAQWIKNSTEHVGNIHENKM